MKPRSCITRKKSDLGSNASVKLDTSASFCSDLYGREPASATLCAATSPGAPRLFARAVLVGANVDQTRARRSRNVDRRRFRGIASSDCYRPGFQPEVVGELGGIETNKHALGAATVDDVVVAVYARLEHVPIRLPILISDDLAFPVKAEADVVIHRHVGVAVINAETVGDIVSDNVVAG